MKIESITFPIRKCVLDFKYHIFCGYTPISPISLSASLSKLLLLFIRMKADAPVIRSHTAGTKFLTLSKNIQQEMEM